MAGKLGKDDTIRIGLDKLAFQICQRGLAAPAVFFLEMNKPLASVLRVVAPMGLPFVAPLFGREICDALTRVIESGTTIEELIVAIERQAQESVSPSDQKSPA